MYHINKAELKTAFKSKWFLLWSAIWLASILSTIALAVYGSVISSYYLNVPLWVFSLASITLGLTGALATGILFGTLYVYKATPKPKVEKPLDFKDPKNFRALVYSLIQKDRDRIRPDYFRIIQACVIISVPTILTSVILLRDSRLFLVLYGTMGSLLWLPLGAVAGWLFFNPFMRAKLMRYATKRNYGVVHLVSRGRNILTQAKDLNQSVLLLKGRLWVIMNNRIYSENCELNDFREIETKHLRSYSGVPIVFLDIDTMTPLSFEKETTKITPEEMGSLTQAYINNQRAKDLFLNKTMKLLLVIAIFLTLITLLVAFDVRTILTKGASMVGSAGGNYVTQ